jgi:hypothetical protein
MMHRSQPTTQYPGVGPITAASLLKPAAGQVVKPEKQAKRRNQTREPRRPTPPETNAAADPFLD